MKDLGSALAAAAEGGHGGLDFFLKDDVVRLSSAEMFERAAGLASLLVGRGVEPGTRVALAGASRPEWALWAWAIWLAGGCLVPVQVPIRVVDQQGFAARCRSLVGAAGCGIVVAQPELAGLFPEHLPVVPWDTQAQAHAVLPVVSEADAAVVQFTSGSTAEPKGAVLSHRAVLMQLNALSERLGDWSDGASTLGWVPFFHDMGLFMFLVWPSVRLERGSVLPTDLFAKDPGRWLDLFAVTRATTLAVPMSAWAAAIRARRGSLEALDMSSVRSALLGAEPIDPAFIDHLLSISHTIQLGPEAVAGGYGLAEATLAVTIAPRKAGVRVESFDRPALTRDLRAVTTSSHDGMRLVSAGVPLSGTQVKILLDGREAEWGQVGDVVVRSPSLMDGYLVDGELRRQTGWLDTGDIGFIHDGELFISGRRKDMMIVLGQNYYPQDFEWAAGRVPGVRPGRCTAFLNEDGSGFVVLVEAQTGVDPADLTSAVLSAVAANAGPVACSVHVLAPDSITKTTSGKLQRGHMRQQYLSGSMPVLVSA